MKRITMLLLVFMLVLTTLVPVSANNDETLDRTWGDILFELGIIQGDGTGLKEDREITREEMVTIVLRLVTQGTETYTPPAKPSFTDVPTSHWAYANVERAKELGITSGLGNGKFGLGQQLTHDQAAAFLLKAMGHTVVWENISTQSRSLGVYSEDALYTDKFVRGHVFEMLAKTLNSTDNKNNAMIYNSGRFDREQVSRFFNAFGEKEYVEYINSTYSPFFYDGDEYYSKLSPRLLELHEQDFYITTFSDFMNELQSDKVEFTVSDETLGNYTYSLNYSDSNNKELTFDVTAEEGQGSSTIRDLLVFRKGNNYIFSGLSTFYIGEEKILEITQFYVILDDNGYVIDGIYIDYLFSALLR